MENYHIVSIVQKEVKILKKTNLNIFQNPETVLKAKLNLIDAHQANVKLYLGQNMLVHAMESILNSKKLISELDGNHLEVRVRLVFSVDLEANLAMLNGQFDEAHSRFKDALAMAQMVK